MPYAYILSPSEKGSSRLPTCCVGYAVKLAGMAMLTSAAGLLPIAAAWPSSPVLPTCGCRHSQH